MRNLTSKFTKCEQPQKKKKKNVKFYEKYRLMVFSVAILSPLNCCVSTVSV